MALRLLEVQLPKDLTETAEQALEEVGAQEVWAESGGPIGSRVCAVVGAGRTGAAIDLLHERLANVAMFRVLVLPLDAVVPRPSASSAEGRGDAARSSVAVSREEVYASVSDGAQLTSTYLVLSALAATVAAIGLTTNNTAAVIGAMVVAPLLGPNIGVALGFTLGDGALLRGAARSAWVGFLVAFLTSLILGLGLEVDPDVPELAARTRLGLSDMLLALAAGAAGTLAYTTGAPAYLVGVMVAVALLPPTVASALLLGAGYFKESLGGLLLVAANVTALTLAAMATFLWKGMRPRNWWQEERARASARRGSGSSSDSSWRSRWRSSRLASTPSPSLAAHALSRQSLYMSTTDGGDRLGAFVEGPRVTLEGALDGALAGLRFAAKDNFDVAGHVSGAGNPDWLRSHGPAETTAVAIQRLLASGASLAGKTIMDELAFGSVGENRHYGTPLNTAAPGRVPGGSSSGSASAVAASVVDFALGTDSACSVRLPASACGLYGMRPTHGRVDIEGVVPLSPSLDTVGWLCRDARTLQRVGDVLLDGPRDERALERLCIAEDAFALASEALREALQPGVARLTGSFAASEPVLIGAPDTARALGLFGMRSGNLQVREVWQCHGQWIEDVQPDSVVLNRENMIVGAESNDEGMCHARAGWDDLRAWILERIPSGSVLCVPTVADLPPRLGASDDERRAFVSPSFSLLAIAVVAGLPQISVPGAQVDGVPVGLSLIGPPGGDEVLLDVVAGLEQRRRGSGSGN